MVTQTKLEFIYNISNYDRDIIERYLNEVKKRSEGAARNHKSAIYECLNYINKPIEAITMIDIKQFFDNVLDKKDVKLSSKEVRRSYLSSFFYHIQSEMLERQIDYRNPVPIKKVYRFTKKEKDFIKVSEKQEEIYTNKELGDILREIKKKSYRDFMLVGILISTGMRLSEALTIKIENINLKERYIETGFEMNARKSNKALLFFFPEGFKIYLETYLNHLDKKSVWLFPGNTTHLQTQSWYIRLKKVYNGKYTKNHKFRKTLITNRIKMGCPLLISEMLINHKSSSVEGKHYIKLSIPEKRNYYDKYFPYSNISYF
jgi:integrase